MTGVELTGLMQSFITLSVFLLIGTFLRAKVPFFQKMFLPASVIGGFLALLIGPQVWTSGSIFGTQLFPAEYMVTWGALPGVLIVPVVASVPLGLAMGRKKAEGAEKKSSVTVVKTFFIAMGLCFVHILVGLLVLAVLGHAFDLYPTFGFELVSGFSGGHGTAGVVGGVLRDTIGAPWWELAQGMTTATATFGLVGGMLIGIVYINIMARRGETKMLSKPTDIPVDMARGIVMDPEKQASLGKETTMNSSIETLTFHLAVILAVCGISYWILGFVQSHNIPLITQIPVWTYAIAIMFIVNYLLNKMGLHVLIDSRTKGRITGFLTDFAIVAAIASMPVRAVLTYVTPLIVLVLAGFISAYIFIMLLSKKVFGEDYHVERAVAMWGASTGVFITGLALLKICDPELKSPSLADFSVAFAISGMIFFVIVPFVFHLMITGLWLSIAVMAGLAIACYIGLFLSNRLAK